MTELVHSLVAVAVGTWILGEDVTARATALGALKENFGQFVLGDLEH